jgi:hypothetical protein
MCDQYPANNDEPFLNPADNGCPLDESLDENDLHNDFEQNFDHFDKYGEEGVDLTDVQISDDFTGLYDSTQMASNDFFDEEQLVSRGLEDCLTADPSQYNCSEYFGERAELLHQANFLQRQERSLLSDKSPASFLPLAPQDNFRCRGSQYSFFTSSNNVVALISVLKQLLVDNWQHENWDVAGSLNKDYQFSFAIASKNNHRSACGQIKLFNHPQGCLADFSLVHGDCQEYSTFCRELLNYGIMTDLVNEMKERSTIPRAFPTLPVDEFDDSVSEDSYHDGDIDPFITMLQTSYSEDEAMALQVLAKMAASQEAVRLMMSKNVCNYLPNLLNCGDSDLSRSTCSLLLELCNTCGRHNMLQYKSDLVELFDSELEHLIKQKVSSSVKADERECSRLLKLLTRKVAVQAFRLLRQL